MRKITLLISALLILCVTVSAHSGKTDANGGHYDRSTGEYHYHHGYPAHQHTDGVCPYDFVDQTDTGTSVNRTEKSDSHVPAQDKSRKTEQKETPLLLSAIAFVLGHIYVFALPFVIWAITKAAKEQLHQHRIYKEEREKYAELYQGKSVFELSGAPVEAWFDANGLPHMKAPGTLDVFTVFVTPSGNCYHRSKCPKIRSGNGKATNICQARSMGKSPCSCCKPMLTLPKWVTEYQRIYHICKKYDIDVIP